MSPELEQLTMLGIKSVVLIGLSVYSIFALIIVRQESLMSGVLEESFEPVLRLMTYIHLVASVALIFIAFLLL